MQKKLRVKFSGVEFSGNLENVSFGVTENGEPLESWELAELNIVPSILKSDNFKKNKAVKLHKINIQKKKRENIIEVICIVIIKMDEGSTLEGLDLAFHLRLGEGDSAVELVSTTFEVMTK